MSRIVCSLQHDCMILRTIHIWVLALILGCQLGACSNGMNEDDSQQYDSRKELLAKQESDNPLSFLDVQADSKKNFFGSTVVRGYVANKATVISYGDVRLQLLSYDDKGKLVEEHEDVLKGYISPNSSADFKLRYRLPKRADSIMVRIMSASVVNQ